jgi:hypothetical protein
MKQTPQNGATNRVRNAIRAADESLVERHPWLGRDDWVAMGFFLLSLVLIAGCAISWLQGDISALLAICGIALAISILHEMEHDIIHDLYLPQPVVRFGVLLTIWVSKASLDPWTRGRLHLWHHAVSGQEEDLEERLIGLGLPWGLKRLLITLCPPASIWLYPGIRSKLRARASYTRRQHLKGPPWWWRVHVLNGILMCTPFLALGGLVAGASWAVPMLVLWVLPNVLRHATIVTMSTNSHYVDIQRGVLVEQNQVLDHPIFWPFQIFCWNFGATHVVHHFYIGQSFWRRTLVFGEVRQVLVDNGVRANDFGSFARANARN